MTSDCSVSVAVQGLCCAAMKSGLLTGKMPEQRRYNCDAAACGYICCEKREGPRASW